MHYGNIEQHVPDLIPDRLGLRVSHPDQHFEVHALRTLPDLSQIPRERQREQVVSRNPKLHVFGSFWSKGPVQDPHEVSVRCPLGFPGC